MGSSGLKSEQKRVESISLTALFEKWCPIYMSYGMSYDEFWKESPYRAKFYRDAHELKHKQKDELRIKVNKLLSLTKKSMTKKVTQR